MRNGCTSKRKTGDNPHRCRSAEGGFVEWLVRAIPARVLEWIKRARQANLRREQLLCPWQGNARVMGVLDGLARQREREFHVAAANTVCEREGERGEESERGREREGRSVEKRETK